MTLIEQQNTSSDFVIQLRDCCKRWRYSKWQTPYLGFCFTQNYSPIRDTSCVEHVWKIATIHIYRQENSIDTAASVHACAPSSTCSIVHLADIDNTWSTLAIEYFPFTKKDQQMF